MNKTPDLRFKWFDVAWEERKLGELTSSFEYGLNAAAKSYDGKNKYIRITDIDDVTRTFLDSDLTSPDCDLALSEKYLLQEGDVVFARTGESVGKTFIYKDSDGIVYYAGFLIRVRLKENVSPQFVFYNTLTKEYEKFIRITSQRSGQPGVNAQEYATFELFLPNYEEQCEIGKFLCSLDNLIIFHQHKYEKLVNIKNTMLQKMFPKDGETVPEIRFPGFDGAWEEKRLGELYIKSGSGGTPLSSNKTYYDGNINFLGISDITNSNGLINCTSKKITEEGLNNSAAWIVPAGAISLAMYASVGKVAILGIDCATSQAFFNMIFKNDETRDFIYQLLKYNEIFGRWNSLISTGTQPNLNAQKIKNYEVLIPSLEEQQKIGSFFKSLDELIERERKQIEMFKTIKQTLLDKMFVGGE